MNEEIDQKNMEELEECIDQTVDALKEIISCQPRSNLKQAIKNAIFSLGKLKPKKPIDLDDGAGFHDRVLSCPSCESPITNVWNKREYKPNFCHFCGQRFKW